MQVETHTQPGKRRVLYVVFFFRLGIDLEVEGPEAELTVGVELTVRVGADCPLIDFLHFSVETFF